MNKKILFLICYYFVVLSSMENSNTAQKVARSTPHNTMLLPCYLQEEYDLAESIVFLPNGNIQAKFKNGSTQEYYENRKEIQETQKKTLSSAITSLITTQEKTASTKKPMPKRKHWV